MRRMCRARLRGWGFAAVAAAAAGFPASPASARCRQPVYVIAHRCNEIGDVAAVVAAQGVNAVEADFDYEDGAWEIDHGGDDLPEPLFSWMLDVNQALVLEDSPLALLILDIKTPEGDLVELYEELRLHLGPEINLLFSTGAFADREHLLQLEDVLAADERAGVAIDELTGNTTMSQVQSFWFNNDIRQYWFGDGIDAKLVTPESVYENMDDAVAFRDSENDCSGFHGAYTWTYESQSSITHFLGEVGVNGIFVNADECHGFAGWPDWEPADVVAFAQGLPGRQFATPNDNPFFEAGPNISCPADITVECTGAAGTAREDVQLVSFFNLAGGSFDNCDDVEVFDDAPPTFACNTTTPVEFMAIDGGPCNPTRVCAANVTVQDTGFPLLDCPDDIAVDPQGPQGAVVHFQAAGSDACDPSPVVECPDSGQSFAVGTTTQVVCTATDFSNNFSACGVQIKVYSPVEVVGNLEALVDGLAGSLNHGQANSLRAHLANVRDAIAADHGNSTCAKLNAFQSKLETFVDHGALTPAEAGPLITSTTNLRATFAC